jgi:DNA-binding transcriptional LysR family regulator
VELLIGRVPRQLVEDDLVFETLLEEPFVAVAGKDSEWARRRRMELSDLIGQSWVLPPYDSAPGVLIAELFDRCGVKPPEPKVASLSIQLTIALVADSGFVGLLPSSLARRGSAAAGASRSNTARRFSKSIELPVSFVAPPVFATAARQESAPHTLPCRSSPLSGAGSVAQPAYGGRCRRW